MIDSHQGSLVVSARMRHRDPILDPESGPRPWWGLVITIGSGLLLWLPILYVACERFAGR